MIISGFQKLTLLDYPNKLACIVFTQGCNFKCAYCQNSDLLSIKTDFDKYGDIIKINWNMDNIKKSIKLIKESTIEHEFRTTINKNDHTIEDLRRICEYLGPDENYYIQNFEQSDYVLDKSLKSFSKDELIRIEKKLKKEFPNVKVRGL